MHSPTREPPRTAAPAVEDPLTDVDPAAATAFSDGEPPPEVSTAWSDRAPPSASDQAYPTQMTEDDLAGSRIQPGLDADTVAQRRGELAAVFGVNVDFLLLLQQAGQGTMRETVDRELPNIARLGARFLRVKVPVDHPEQCGDYRQVLEGVAAFNAAHPDRAIKVDLLANPHVDDFTRDGAAAVGRRCAQQVGDFLATCGAPLVAASVASIELFNEPENEWQDEAIGLDNSGAAQRDSVAANAGMAALEGQLPGGVAVTPAAHEWDPASEQAVLDEVAAQLAGADGDPATLQATAATAIGNSGFAERLAQFAGDYRTRRFADRDPGDTVDIPISLHVYNNPLVSRALIDAVAAIAESVNCVFEVRVTEYQVDAFGHDHPSDRQLAYGVVDLGVHLMDAAAQHADRIQIAQMIAFSYHHFADAADTGTDFGLAGNPDLGPALGRD